MAARRSLYRLALNVLLDSLLAALAVPAARWLVDPASPWMPPLWIPAAGAAVVLLAGIPFGLSRQYWRFAGMGDLLHVAAASVAGAAILALLLHLAGAAPASPAFPAAYALTLAAFLAGPRVLYRQMQGRRAGRAAEASVPADAQAVLLVGEGEDADLFIRASAGRGGPAFRVVGLLALGSRQT